MFLYVCITLNVTVNVPVIGQVDVNRELVSSINWPVSIIVYSLMIFILCYIV